MDISITNQFLGNILVDTSKKAILETPYKDKEELEAAKAFLLSRVTQLVLVNRDRDWFGVASELDDNVRELLSKVKFSPTEATGQFSWHDNTGEALDMFMKAMSNPAVRGIIEPLLQAYSELKVK